MKTKTWMSEEELGSTRARRPQARGFFSAPRRKAVITYYHYPSFNPVPQDHFPNFIGVHLRSSAVKKGMI